MYHERDAVKGTDLCFLSFADSKLKTPGTPEHLRTNVHFADLRLSKRSTQHSLVPQIVPKFHNKISFFVLAFFCTFAYPHMK